MSGKRSLSAVTPADFAGVKFVFLDRDGVINRNPPVGKYVTSWRDVEMLPGVERAIALLNQSGRKVIIVTNQRSIALGLLSETDLQEIHANLRMRLNSFGARIDAIYHCPHDEGQCRCRKPGTGLFEFAFRDFPEACPANSVMIGDSDSDVLAGAKKGMKTILITASSELGADSIAAPTAAAKSLLDAVETFLL